MSDYEGRLRQFEVVAFGCHERAHRRMTELLRSEAEGVQTYLFVEYFCVEPVPLTRIEEASEETRFFFPFIRRLVEANQFLWVWEEDRATFRLLPKTAEVMSHFEDAASFHLPAPWARIGSAVLNWWKIGGSPKTDAIAEEVEWPPIWRYASQDWVDHLEFVRRAPDTERDILLREFALVGQPWVGNPDHSLVFGFPIATDAIFYGYFVLILPGQSDAEKEKAIQEKVQDSLGKLAENLYLPVLTVLAESLLEKELSEQIHRAVKNGLDWKQVAKDFMSADRIPFLHPNAEDGREENAHKDCPTPDRPYAADMERPLHHLWLRRKEMLRRVDTGEHDHWAFLNTLAFGDYFVASPGLIEQLRQVMSVNLRMPAERSGLPAALVYGGPGSGKDVLVRLVPLFSADYFFNDVYAVNMAGVRPGAITGPLLQGVHLAYSAAPEQDSSKKFGLEGLLVEAKKRTKSRRKTREEDKDRNGATFILDELNSLDVDLQGILLRILEQGEVMPLFGLEREYVQHLVIGVVNEDPEEISHESELRMLLREKGTLGSLIGGLLYETLRRTRRLREDLYHRLKRQLYLRVPQMKERTEDIPMLFYLFAFREGEAFGIKNLIVELNAYRLLMDPRIPWPGNIRQVHSVARRIVRVAQERPSLPEGGSMLTVCYKPVLKALKDEFEGIRLDDSEDEEPQK